MRDRWWSEGWKGAKSQTGGVPTLNNEPIPPPPRELEHRPVRAKIVKWSAHNGKFVFEQPEGYGVSLMAYYTTGRSTDTEKDSAEKFLKVLGNVEIRPVDALCDSNWTVYVAFKPGREPIFFATNEPLLKLAPIDYEEPPDEDDEYWHHPPPKPNEPAYGVIRWEMKF